jgi:hypothetical protein
MGHSMREILAAWAFCGVVGFGALTVIGHRESGIAEDTRVHIPDRLGSAHPGLSVADEFADDASDAVSTASNSEEPSVYSRQDVAESSRCRLRLFGRRLLGHVGVVEG